MGLNSNNVSPIIISELTRAASAQPFGRTRAFVFQPLLHKRPLVNDSNGISKRGFGS